MDQDGVRNFIIDNFCDVCFTVIDYPDRWMLVMNDSEETEERWIRALSILCGQDLNISSVLSEEEGESESLEAKSDLSWASRASAPRVWTSESDDEEEEDTESAGELPVIQDKFVIDIEGAKEMEEEIEEENASQEVAREYGNFAGDVGDDREEIVNVEEEKYDSMPEAESVNDEDLWSSSDESSDLSSLGMTPQLQKVKQKLSIK